jgi:hypothetical protein
MIEFRRKGAAVPGKNFADQEKILLPAPDQEDA